MNTHQLVNGFPASWSTRASSGSRTTRPTRARPACTWPSLRIWEIYEVKYSAFVILVWLPIAAAQGANWPQWRGPYFNGSTDEKNLPSQWSKTENIAWSVDLAGAAASTPIVWENRVFLSGVDARRDMLQAVCFDRANGKLLWNHDVAKGVRQDSRSNYANSSPVTDGKRAVFLYGNGDLVCFDMEGTRQWARNLQRDFGPMAFFWTRGGPGCLDHG